MGKKVGGPLEVCADLCYLTFFECSQNKGGVAQLVRARDS